MPPSEPSPNRPRIERLWQRDLPVRLLPAWLGLAAASGFYRIGVGARHLYWRMVKRRAPVLTVSVGNLTVGGTGKTPFTLFLAKRLQSHGLRVGIVSRGYHRARSRARAELVADGGQLKISPEEAGDEPAMMAKTFTGPIAVAKRRIDGIELLSKLGPLDVVILDDAFQHVRLSRDVDLVLVSDERGFGNGWMLPAGPMRESINALGRADAIIVTNTGTCASAIRPSQMKKLTARKVLHASVRPRALLVIENGAWRETPLGLGGRRVLAVSGLADSSGFNAMLRELDADLVGVFEYPDHHAYTNADWQAIVNAMRDTDLVVTTEKDLVKLERFPFPRDSLYALRLEVTMDAVDTRALDELILGRVTAATANA
ncbi:MAG TPA: tetraacyldisaccharide 4'-kinase [Candidatus Binatus sp.]|uniref:tetraacyldisaccharide 4'-kinase n=1 Tax=Candidatus Binatus sp. TaxID=2811406 RepID=UPI002B49A10B|nr:tetraacyldisaccharide 4'-kinase [Candidatus Binatus sp.]HKN14151.1 tetraacyldisaccharide 4'-kinase [Candidatus Binatus sp.]